MPFSCGMANGPDLLVGVYIASNEHLVLKSVWEHNTIASHFLYANYHPLIGCHNQIVNESCPHIRQFFVAKSRSHSYCLLMYSIWNFGGRKLD